MLVYIKPLSIFPDLHSDTLFGAITYAISELYPELVDEMINNFNNEPPFILSSTFPFAFENNLKIKFYPKILLKHEDYEVDIDIGKKYKKINYLEEDIFFKLINGQLNEEDILNNFSNYYSHNGLLMTKNHGINFSLSNTIIPNNSINRLTNETENIFYTSGNEFKNLGLFFFVEFNNKEYKPIFKGALKFLKDRGLGKDISVGKGHFDYEIEDFDIGSLEDNYGLNNGNYFVSLSRFIPTEEDLSKINEFSTYEIGSKRGRSSSGEIRKEIKFFKEGSIFPHYKKHYGQIIQSGKNSPAVEYGFAFPLKVIIKEGD